MLSCVMSTSKSKITNPTQKDNEESMFASSYARSVIVKMHKKQLEMYGKLYKVSLDILKLGE